MGNRDESIDTNIQQVRSDITSLKDELVIVDSATKVTVLQTDNIDSNTVKISLTPTAGKKIRALYVNPVSYSTLTAGVEVYFGGSANITVKPSGAIYSAQFNSTLNAPPLSWSAGEGPLGGLDETVSIRTSGVNNIFASGLVVFGYREE